MHLNMNGEDFRHPDMHLLELLAVVQLQTIVLDDLAAFAHGHRPMALSWQHRALLDGFCCSKAWEEFAHTMDSALHEAQAKWDVKFGKTWTESAATVLCTTSFIL